MERNFKGVWIPKEIWLNEDLSIQEKVFLVEIDSLDNENGCIASNDYFSKFFKLSKNRCSEVIKGLEVKGLVNITYKYKEGTKSIEKRIIKVIGKPNTTYSENRLSYSKKCEDNNTINNTNNIYRVIQEKWNNEVALPSIRSMTNSRKGSINARVKEFDEETVLKVIDMVSKSDFLLGKQGDWNNCNFDWVFKPSNFAKILEGNYNKTTTVKEEKKEVYYNPESNFNNISNVEEMRKRLGI